MALDMYSESSSLSSSPTRLSFSHNLHQQDTSTTSQIENHPNRLDSSLLDSNLDFNFCTNDDTIQPIDANLDLDFDFCISNNSDTIQPIDANQDFGFCTTDDTIQSIDADELFSQGQIRPLQLQERFTHSNSNSQLPPLPTTLSKNGIFIQETSSKNIMPTTLSKNGIFNQETSSKDIIITDQNQPNSSSSSSSKSIWGIKRSSSVHVEENTYKKGSFWSSLPLLSRSNSTGSVPSPKQTSQRQPKNSGAAGSSFYMYTLSQKPPLKRNYGNGVRINPVLNVPPHFISKGTAGLFGLGSLFGNGKDKKNKK